MGYQKDVDVADTACCGLWCVVAPDAISAHDVSVKISRPFRAEHSCPHRKRRAVRPHRKRRAVRRLAFGFSGPPCFLCCPYQTEEKTDVEHLLPRCVCAGSLCGGDRRLCHKKWIVPPMRLSCCSCGGLCCWIQST